MKRNKHLFITAIMSLILALSFTTAYGMNGKMQKNQGAIGVQTGMYGVISTLPADELSVEEELSLIKMREEEKLARDVYATLYDIWQLPVFYNISLAEQRHMNAVKVLIDKYGLVDPVADSTIGVFTDPDFQTLYDAYVEQGSASLIDALYVGATIEDMDIADLQELLTIVDNADITIVYGNLLRGSRNHLRAFTYLLSLQGETYEAQYITAEELAAIITSPRETGNQAGNTNGTASGGANAGNGSGTGTCTNF